MTVQNKEETVVVTLVQAFNFSVQRFNENPEGFVRETEFLDGVAEAVRQRDPAALSQPGQWVVSNTGGTYSALLKGDAAKIIAGLSDVFREAHAHGRALLSESLADRSTEWATTQKNAREILLTLTEPMFSVVTKEKLPVRFERF